MATATTPGLNPFKQGGSVRTCEIYRISLQRLCLNPFKQGGSVRTNERRGRQRPDRS